MRKEARMAGVVKNRLGQLKEAFAGKKTRIIGRLILVLLMASGTMAFKGCDGGGGDRDNNSAMETLQQSFYDNDPSLAPKATTAERERRKTSDNDPLSGQLLRETDKSVIPDV